MKKLMICLLLAMLPALMSMFLYAQNPQSDSDATRQRWKDQLSGDWVFEDLDAAFKEAKKTGKPLMIVFR